MLIFFFTLYGWWFHIIVLGFQSLTLYDFYMTFYHHVIFILWGLRHASWKTSRLKTVILNIDCHLPKYDFSLWSLHHHIEPILAMSSLTSQPSTWPCIITKLCIPPFNPILTPNLIWSASIPKCSISNLHYISYRPLVIHPLHHTHSHLVHLFPFWSPSLHLLSPDPHASPTTQLPISTYTPRHPYC